MELIRGANTIIVPAGAQDTHAVLVGLRWPDADLDVSVSAFAVGGDGKVVSEEHFVFFNNASSPDCSLWLLEPTESTVEDRGQIGIVLDALPADAAKVIVAVAVMGDGPETLASLGRLEGTITSLQTGASLATFVAEGLFVSETLVNVMEIYRYQGGWKARAVLQGYNSGLAGIAADLGIEIA